MAAGNIWDEVLARIEGKVNRHSFYTWFKPTAFLAERNGEIIVRVPNLVFRDWLTKHYSSVITEALADVHRSGLSVQFVVDGAVPDPEPEAPTAQVTAEELQASGDLVPAPITGQSGLNTRYTFANFIAESGCLAIVVPTADRAERSNWSGAAAPGRHARVGSWHCTFSRPSRSCVRTGRSRACPPTSGR